MRPKSQSVYSLHTYTPANTSDFVESHLTTSPQAHKLSLAAQKLRNEESSVLHVPVRLTHHTSYTNDEFHALKPVVVEFMDHGILHLIHVEQHFLQH